MNWPWLIALVLVLGAVVLVARTFGHGFEPRRTAQPTPETAVAPTRVAPVAEARTPTSVAQQRRLELATPTPARTRPPAAAATRTTAPTPTPHLVQAAATPTPQPLQGTPTHGPVATLVVTAAVQAASTPMPVRATGAVVALTFDAGADRGYAEDILDQLADDHVVGSFGITGNWARANPDMVRRMAADGHLVFNHTLDHRSFTGVSDSLGGLSAAARRAELDQADTIIAPLIGHSTKPFFRLPYGDNDAHASADVAADGYTRKIGWTVDSLGWRGLATQDIVARCLKLAAPGAVYVFHVGRASQDSAALGSIIAGLRARGFGFVRVDQL